MEAFWLPQRLAFCPEEAQCASKYAPTYAGTLVVFKAVESGYQQGVQSRWLVRWCPA